MTIRSEIDSRCLATPKAVESSKKLNYLTGLAHSGLLALAWRTRNAKAEAGSQESESQKQKKVRSGVQIRMFYVMILGLELRDKQMRKSYIIFNNF